MALSGLDIYKLLPKTNCKDCGFATCLAFAMALAQKKVSLDKCPHVTAEARSALESASQPPIKLVAIGSGPGRIELGNETVMYRHEQKFHHPAVIGFLVEDTSDDSAIDKSVAGINALEFERVGQKIGAGLICIDNRSGSSEKFANAARRVAAGTKLNIALSSSDAAAAADAIRYLKSRRPLVICRSSGAVDGFIDMAKENGVPLAITCAGLDEAASLTDRLTRAGVSEIMINFDPDNAAQKIRDFTYARRAALKKNLRSLGYPIVTFTRSAEPSAELAEAVSCVSKYAGLVIMKNADKDFVFPLLVARQDIYQDPQKPVQVEPGVYEIGNVTIKSPVLITTNFSITYFTVAGEVESSKVPSYIICCDAEGMSVLTAWAAEKLTSESIWETIKNSGIEKRVAHKKVILPGYVSVLSGKLEEISGYKVSVGPREASGITAYLRAWK